MPFYPDYPPEYDEPAYEHIRSSKPVARKQHTCVICKKTIMPGTRYNRHVYTIEGEFTTEATCLRHFLEDF